MSIYITAAIITTLVIIIIGFLYTIIILLKKIKSAKPDGLTLIEFPSETNKKINDLIENIISFSSAIDNSVNKDQKKILNDQKEVVKEISEQLKTFETFAKEKSKELAQYKEGYDLNKNKALFLSIINSISFINSALIKIKEENNIAKDYLVATKDKLEIILSNYSIEKFSPEINKKITEIEGCEPLLETVDTNDDHKVNCIHSVVKPGYEIRITEKEKRILKKAEVKVYSKEEKQ